MDDNKKEIVDSQGRPIHSLKTNKIKEFILSNVWNLLGTGVAIINLFSIVASRNYAITCADYYGIDKKYFSGTEMFQDKLFFLFGALLLFVYPFIFYFINKTRKSKASVIGTSIISFLILFLQNILHTITLIELVKIELIRRLIGSWFFLIVLLVSDVIIVYLIVVKNYFGNNKKHSRKEEIVLTVALIICLVDIASGFTMKLNYQISDKKAYEVFEDNKVIVSNYDGKFVVMDCEVQGENLIIKKGTYSLEELTGVKITYYEYNEVICE